MSHRRFEPMTAVALAVAIVSLVPVLFADQAQTRSAKTKTWTPPRTPDGQPDLQGYWILKDWGGNLENETTRQAADQEANRRPPIVDPPDAKIPYQPWAAAKIKDIKDHAANVKGNFLLYVDTQAWCGPSGVPRFIAAVPYNGYQFIQTSGQVLLIAEFNHQYRIIPLDGRPHVGRQIGLWMGDSRGHWQGNTLVVDVTNFNGKQWLDGVGNFHSDALHVVERYTIVDENTIAYEATLDDPKVYTRPWKLAWSLDRATRKGPPPAAYMAPPGGTEACDVFGTGQQKKTDLPCRVTDGAGFNLFDTPTENYQIYEHACHEGNRYVELVK